MERKKGVNPYFGTAAKPPIPPHRKEAPTTAEIENVVETAVSEAPAPVLELTETKKDLLADLKNKKPVGKGYNIYLDADVIETVDKLAKQAKTSRSKVLNTLLRNLLLDK